MDSVRFGRALGMGARAAAKTLVTAVDAATSPSPSAGVKANTAHNAAPSESRAAASGVRLGEQAARTATQARQTKEGLARGGKRFGEAVWGPFVKLSGVLWLEVTGGFFGIFPLFAATRAGKLRGDLHGTVGKPDAHMRFLLFDGIA